MTLNTYIFLVIFILFTLFVCHDDADPQGIKDGVIPVWVVWFMTELLAKKQNIDIYLQREETEGEMNKRYCLFCYSGLIGLTWIWLVTAVQGGAVGPSEARWL